MVVALMTQVIDPWGDRPQFVFVVTAIVMVCLLN